MQLPTSVKQAECTVQRFFLFLWPLLNMAESGNYDKAKELTVKFVDLMLHESQYSLKIKIDSLVQLYSSVHTNSGIKSLAFEKLIQVCLEAQTTDIIVQRAREIATESANWNLKVAERRSLYQTVGRALDQIGEASAAFKLIHAYLKLYKEGDADLAQTEDDARRCVILAIKAVNVINFAELEDLASVKLLTKKHQKVFSLLSLFTQATAKEFKGRLGDYRELMGKEGLTEQELIVKKSYVQICTLNTQVTNFTYSELAELLNVSLSLP